MNKLIAIGIMLCSIFITSCDKDEIDDAIKTTTSTTQKITKPTFDKDISTSDKASFSIRVRFKTGGDSEYNLGTKVHWAAYSSLQTKKPSKKDLTKSETMRQYGSATYHNTGSKKGMTESIVFDKSHAGYSGSYIYFYVECFNSKGSAETSVMYVKAR